MQRMKLIKARALPENCKRSFSTPLCITYIKARAFFHSFLCHSFLYFISRAAIHWASPAHYISMSLRGLKPVKLTSAKLYTLTKIYRKRFFYFFILKSSKIFISDIMRKKKLVQKPQPIYFFFFSLHLVFVLNIIFFASAVIKPYFSFLKAKK